MPQGAEGPFSPKGRAGLFLRLGLCLVDSDIGIKRGDAKTLGRGLWQALQPCGCPKASTFGFKCFEIEVGHPLALGRYVRRVNGGQLFTDITADIGNGP
jgi:hypothetical protein